MTDNQQQQDQRPRGGYLGSTQDDVERLHKQYVDAEIDEDELARQLTEDRLREHEKHKRRQRKAKRQWRLIGFGAMLFFLVTFVWAQQTGVPL